LANYLTAGLRGGKNTMTREYGLRWLADSKGDKFLLVAAATKQQLEIERQYYLDQGYDVEVVDEQLKVTKPVEQTQK